MNIQAIHSKYSIRQHFIPSIPCNVPPIWLSSNQVKQASSEFYTLQHQYQQKRDQKLPRPIVAGNMSKSLQIVNNKASS